MLYFFKKIIKDLDFKIFENYDLQFLPCRAFNFNFYEKNITTSRNYSSFARVKSFPKQILFHSLCEVRVRFGWTVF